MEKDRRETKVEDNPYPPPLPSPPPSLVPLTDFDLLHSMLLNIHFTHGCVSFDLVKILSYNENMVLKNIKTFSQYQVNFFMTLAGTEFLLPTMSMNTVLF